MLLAAFYELYFYFYAVQILLNFTFDFSFDPGLTRNVLLSFQILIDFQFPRYLCILDTQFNSTVLSEHTLYDLDC